MQRLLLRYGEVVLVRLRPVDELDVVSDDTGLHFHVHTIAQEPVDLFVVVVEASIGVVGFPFQSKRTPGSCRRLCDVTILVICL